MENNERIVNARNRVFETKNGPAAGKNITYAMSTNSSSIYRSTGMNQIKDILISDYIRPREKRVKGRHVNEVFWSKGSEKLYYFNRNNIILEVPITKVVDGQMGALSFDDLVGI